MDDLQTASSAVQAIIGILLLMLSIKYLLLPSVHDYFRQRVFALRRELFMLMADGEIRSDARAYRAMYRLMNNVIRFAERLTLLRLMIFNAISLAEQEDRFELALAELSDDVKGKIESLRVRLGAELLIHMLLASPLGWLMFPVAGIVEIVKHALGIKRLTEAAFRRIGGLRSARRLEYEACALDDSDFQHEAA